MIAVSYAVIDSYSSYIVSQDNTIKINVGMVLGAGITKDGRPYDQLKARLDSGADAINTGKVQKLILSGDNRFEHYDEPTAMYNYLITVKGIPAEKLVLDYAGRSTYESCERATKIFGVNKLIIFSAASHLPRAIYLCRTFGVEAYGVSNTVEANNSLRRELLARVKALYNVHLLGEQTVLGEKVGL